MPLQLTYQEVPHDPNQGDGSDSSRRTASGTEEAVIDLSGALVRMSGMKSLYLRCAREFANALPAIATDFQQKVHSDPSEAVRLMHTLKGTSALLGAMALSHEAAKLEKLCKSAADPSEILSHTVSLERQMETTIRALGDVIVQMEQEPGLLRIPRDGGHDSMLMADSIPF